MRAKPGDRLKVSGYRVGEPERHAEILEVRGAMANPLTTCVGPTVTRVSSIPAPTCASRTLGTRVPREASALSQPWNPRTQARMQLSPIVPIRMTWGATMTSNPESVAS